MALEFVYYLLVQTVGNILFIVLLVALFPNVVFYFVQFLTTLSIADIWAAKYQL